MKEYDLIAIGSGSAMNIVDPMIRQNPDMKVAVIDKDEPGGICLTRGCIPSKILLYPAELIRTVERTDRFGIEIDVKSISFRHIMERMRDLINSDKEGIRRGLTESKNIDYYHDLAKFVEPYTLEVAGERIRSDMIVLCTGSEPIIPEISSVGLRENEAVERYGEDGVLVGAYRYEDTAKGEAMDVEDYFVKVIVRRDGMRILGAHIIGPYASILIQEVINLMYTSDRSMWPMVEGMHIHPALSEVVEQAFNSLMPPHQYHHLMEHHYGLSLGGAYGPVSESHHHQDCLTLALFSHVWPSSDRFW